MNIFFKFPALGRVIFVGALSVSLFLGTACKKNDDSNGDDGGDNGGNTPSIEHKHWLNADLTYNIISDIDGNEYATIVIGNQEWMAENLRATRYCNGDLIPNVTNDSAWAELKTAAWVNYENLVLYDSIFGKLYNWYAVDDSRNICPCGWHVPSESEWMTLINYIGGIDSGGKLKSTETFYWQVPNAGATNESGFSAMPGGKRIADGPFDNNMGKISNMWSSTEVNIHVSSTRRLFHSLETISENYGMRREGLSVRCVKD